MFRICWHKWTNWSAAKQTYDSTNLRQVSKCTKCGALRTRSFGTEQHVTAQVINEAVENDKEINR